MTNRCQPGFVARWALALGVASESGEKVNARMRKSVLAGLSGACLAAAALDAKARESLAAGGK
jgi:hypothetical protein